MNEILLILSVVFFVVAFLMKPVSRYARLGIIGVGFIALGKGLALSPTFFIWAEAIKISLFFYGGIAFIVIGTIGMYREEMARSTREEIALIFLAMMFIGIIFVYQHTF